MAGGGGDSPRSAWSWASAAATRCPGTGRWSARTCGGTAGWRYRPPPSSSLSGPPPTARLATLKGHREEGNTY